MYVKSAQCLALAFSLLLICGCGAVNLGKWKGIERTSPDEHFYLVKEAFLSPGTAFGPKDNFDHNLNESVNLIFTPSNEKNKYVAESIWYDPSGQEFKAIRRTYDLQEEGKKDVDRPKKGAMRVHTMPTKELSDHKPGMWRVNLYIDNTLVRKLTFFVR